jgi:hypothetical protein
MSPKSFVVRIPRPIGALLAALTACVLLGAPGAARAHSTFHQVSLSDSDVSAQVGDTITYQIQVSSTNSTAQIIIGAGTQTGELSWTGDWSGSGWSCTGTIAPPNPVCFYYRKLPLNESTTPVSLNFEVVAATSSDCWLSSQIPGPCAFLGAAAVYSDGHVGPVAVEATPIVTAGETDWRRREAASSEHPPRSEDCGTTRRASRAPRRVRAEPTLPGRSRGTPI